MLAMICSSCVKLRSLAAETHSGPEQAAYGGRDLLVLSVDEEVIAVQNRGAESASRIRPPTVDLLFAYFKIVASGERIDGTSQPRRPAAVILDRLEIRLDYRQQQLHHFRVPKQLLGRSFDGAKLRKEIR